jgi:uncharacterized protein with NAD-binding domain and iron-sulfur cluster
MRDEPGDTPARAAARVKANAVRYLEEHVGPVWSGAVRSAGAGFDWQLLAGSDQRGKKRFDSQFWRANFPPTERYVLSPAGQIAFRLRTDESGYDNLYLTGDWINNGGLKGGCIESATMSGLQTARAIIGSAEPIVGEDHHWLIEHRAPAGRSMRGRAAVRSITASRRRRGRRA